MKLFRLCCLCWCVSLLEVTEGFAGNDGETVEHRYKGGAFVKGVRPLTTSQDGAYVLGMEKVGDINVFYISGPEGLCGMTCIRTFPDNRHLHIISVGDIRKNHIMPEYYADLMLRMPRKCPIDFSWIHQHDGVYFKLGNQRVVRVEAGGKCVVINDNPPHEAFKGGRYLCQFG